MSLVPITNVARDQKAENTKIGTWSQNISTLPEGVPNDEFETDLPSCRDNQWLQTSVH